MAIRGGRSPLLGRGRETARLERLVADVRAGSSAVLVLRGAPGIGKTALLDHVAEEASDCCVLRAAGVQSEMEIPYAGLHQLCAPLLRALERLPPSQRDALRTVLGLRDLAVPERFLVGLAVLTLLSEAASDRPLVCLVDDVQWLDRASGEAMAFAARRLHADPVAMVFAGREPSEERRLDGLPDLAVEGIGDDDARRLLASVMPGWLDPRVRDRIIAETRGNPLAVLEVPRSASPAELADGFAAPARGHLTSRIEQGFVSRYRAMPGVTQRLLLTAAAEPTGDASLLWRAAARMGIETGAAGPAVDDGLVELGARVRFRHPLVRSAIYGTALPGERHLVHRALADVTDPALDPDRRGWHRAYAAAGPDEDVAEELESSAARAQRRGGMAAAAAFLERATELTPDPRCRGRRALAAARAAYQAGAADRATELLATAALGPLDELELAGTERLRAQIAFSRSRGVDAVFPLLGAARRLERLDADLARETYLEAIAATVFAGRFLDPRQRRAVAEAARSAAPRAGPVRAPDLMLSALATRVTEGFAAGAPVIRRALDGFRQDDGESARRWLWLASRAAPEVWDDAAWFRLATRQTDLARQAGSLTLLAVAINSLAYVQVHRGDFVAAAALLDEEDVIAELTGSAPIVHTALVLAAWRGDEEAVPLIAALGAAATRRGEGRALTMAEYATAVLENGLGHYEAALAAAESAAEHDELVVPGWALVEMVEAAVRSGHRDLAEAACGRLAARSGLSDTDWARGIEARSRALLSDGDVADALYREGIERLSRSSAVAQLARAHLLYGEWLRREGRRADAREHLRTAHDAFTRMGAHAFAERAGRELFATGETVRGRSGIGRPELTAQEAQVARLACAGLTNPEIAAQLYLSSRTVEWHLRKVFVKLDISSRRDLQRVLPDFPPLGAGARPRHDLESRATSAASSGSPRPPSAAP
ncbi:AAA family ATPase [Geodermatophilus sp. YIM 151500]|uniref:ATP-binding protein n=1 Tax=Geodermatophilus sp. YIM 151500 TaxID=2984531 RepID=UPI0021E4D405|nr:LuxR family transcriptional regulator [Geodermatophilus sp. YIM 151500]MCV2490956.1 AAA family ATPase [Geodermatophilus sp. YIM 151500]